MAKKIRARGVTLATPYFDYAVFRRKVVDLCPGRSFDEQTLHDLYTSLGFVVGKWSDATYQPEVLFIANKLAATARILEQLGHELSHETGIHQTANLEFALLVKKALALNPLVGDLPRAGEKLESFQRDCSEMSHVFSVAFRLLKDKHGKPGRRKLDWYDDFAASLLRLAKLAHIEPNLGKSRITGARNGWLFDAAQSLESFLYPEMRSPSPEACGKRLERSLRRLRSRHRQ